VHSLRRPLRQGGTSSHRATCPFYDARAHVHSLRCYLTKVMHQFTEPRALLDAIPECWTHVHSLRYSLTKVTHQITEPRVLLDAKSCHRATCILQDDIPSLRATCILSGDLFAKVTYSTTKLTCIFQVTFQFTEPRVLFAVVTTLLSISTTNPNNFSIK